MKQVDFYFDFISPYVSLASHQLGEVRDCTAAKFRLCAGSFCGAFKSSLEFGACGNPRRRYTFQDVQRWADYIGLEFKSPPAHHAIPDRFLSHVGHVVFPGFNA
jgi:2-hydroxychromene-2-carboxylate isomerase